jgi:6-phosphogluconolactonase
MSFPFPSFPCWLLPVLALLLPAAALPDSRPSEAPKKPKLEKLWVYVGTYNRNGSKGIYRLEMDLASGKLTPKGLAAAASQPSFLAIHPNQRFLYAVSEVDDFGGKPSGAIRAFAIEKTGKLTLLNEQPSGGAGPCHLVVDKKGKHVLAANYGGGSACVLPIRDDGSLGKATAFKQHKGSSVDKDRQKGPHAHSINLDAANRFAFVADLGLDKVLIYRYDAKKGTLTENDPASVAVSGSSGPRHFAFHPNGKNAYVINEMKSTVTALDYDAKQGVLKPVETVSTLPRGYKGNTSTAEVQVHASGKFLYGSNRGHNSITIFTIDPKTGKLTFVGHQASQIKTPRNFAIDPTGTFLVVANQDSDSLVVFRIDPESGKLKPTGNKVKVPFPVCVKMMPPRS